MLMGQANFHGFFFNHTVTMALTLVTLTKVLLICNSDLYRFSKTPTSDVRVVRPEGAYMCHSGGQSQMTYFVI